MVREGMVQTAAATSHNVYCKRSSQNGLARRENHESIGPFAGR